MIYFSLKFIFKPSKFILLQNEMILKMFTKLVLNIFANDLSSFKEIVPESSPDNSQIYNHIN